MWRRCMGCDEMTTEPEPKDQISKRTTDQFGWRNYLILIPVALSGVLWLMSLETRLHEDSERIMSINQHLNILEERMKSAEAGIADPRPKPQALTEIEAIKRVLEERNERINKLEERINSFNSIVLDSFLHGVTTPPQKH